MKEKASALKTAAITTACIPRGNPMLSRTSGDGGSNDPEGLADLKKTCDHKMSDVGGGIGSTYELQGLSYVCADMGQGNGTHLPFEYAFVNGFGL